MTQKQEEEIVYHWHYEGEYSFYDMEADKEDLVEFVDSQKRGDQYFAVMKDNAMIGFFSFHKLADHTVVLV